jgi:hypothetical protein
MDCTLKRKHQPVERKRVHETRRKKRKETILTSTNVLQQANAINFTTLSVSSPNNSKANSQITPANQSKTSSM